MGPEFTAAENVVKSSSSVEKSEKKVIHKTFPKQWPEKKETDVTFREKTVRIFKRKLPQSIGQK